jgi:hypothetical protein
MHAAGSHKLSLVPVSSRQADRIALGAQWPHKITVRLQDLSPTTTPEVLFAS